MLEYNPSYAESVATNEEERPARATYNKGFPMRKFLLGASATVNCVKYWNWKRCKFNFSSCW